MIKKLPERPLNDYFTDEVEARAKLLDYARDVYMTPALELEERRRAIGCMDSILSKERSRYEEKQKEFRNRWIMAAQKLEDIEKSMKELNPHYSELMVQKERSIQMAVRQESLKSDKLKDIEQLKKEKLVLTKIKLETLNRLQNFKSVEDYLNGVVLASQGEFKNIRELLERATLLNSTRKSQVDREEEAREHVQRRERQLYDIKMIKANEAISLNNVIYELQQHLNASSFQCKGLQEDLAHFKYTAAQRTMDLGSVRMSIYNLYLRICSTLRRQPKIPASDTLKQIRDIHSYMKEIVKLRSKVGYLLKKAHQEAVKGKKADDIRLRIEFEKRNKTTLTKKEDIRDIFKLKAEVKADSTQERLNKFLRQKYNVESLKVQRHRTSSASDSKASASTKLTSTPSTIPVNQSVKSSLSKDKQKSNASS